MREFKDGGEPAGGTDPLTRVDFWKRERVPAPRADDKAAGRARRRLEGSVSLDRIVVASSGLAAPPAASRDAEQADHQRQFERGSALDWRQPDVAVPARAGVGVSVWTWALKSVAAVRGGALNGLGFARAHISRRAGAVAAVAVTVLGVAVVLFGQLDAGTAGRARTPRVSAASIGRSPAVTQSRAATRQNTGRSSGHFARRERSRHVVRQRHSSRHPAISRPTQVTGSTVATTRSTPAPSGTTSPAPARPVAPAPAPTPTPVSNPNPGHSSDSSSGSSSGSGSGSGSGSSSAHRPAFGLNGSLGPGHGVGTG